tara:strand:+ start:2449 stop:2730 length:282 start_codon:yes stop_codon:yes gene_type:complete
VQFLPEATFFYFFQEKQRRDNTMKIKWTKDFTLNITVKGDDGSESHMFWPVKAGKTHLVSDVIQRGGFADIQFGKGQFAFNIPNDYFECIPED